MPRIMLKKTSSSCVELPDLPNKNAGQPGTSEFQINNREYFNIGIS